MWHNILRTLGGSDRDLDPRLLSAELSEFPIYVFQLNSNMLRSLGTPFVVYRYVAPRYTNVVHAMVKHHVIPRHPPLMPISQQIYESLSELD